MSRVTLKQRRFKAGYVIRTERLTGEDAGGSPIEVKTAYTPTGDYIGCPKMAHGLIVKLGIAPEKIDQKKSKVCSIGFCASTKRWSGWSHRAICSFGIGDKIFEESFGDDSTPYIQHGKMTIRTLQDAKKAAIAFARSVS